MSDKPGVARRRRHTSKPFYAGHHHVGKDDVGSDLLRFFDGLGAVGGCEEECGHQRNELDQNAGLFRHPNGCQESPPSRPSKCQNGDRRCSGRDRSVRVVVKHGPLLPRTVRWWALGDAMADLASGAVVDCYPFFIFPMAVTSLPVVFGDEIRLREVFQNLIGNAAVPTHPGPTGRVEISCTDSGEMWEFSVSDDGDGIDPRHHDRIFMLFERLQAQPDADSTGVGLAVTKKIVENAGGTIRVQSDGVPGAGSTFHFTWPKKEGNSR